MFIKDLQHYSHYLIHLIFHLKLMVNQDYLLNLPHFHLVIFKQPKRFKISFHSYFLYFQEQILFYHHNFLNQLDDKNYQVFNQDSQYLSCFVVKLIVIVIFIMGYLVLEQLNYLHQYYQVQVCREVFLLMMHFSWKMFDFHLNYFYINRETIFQQQWDLLQKYDFLQIHDLFLLFYDYGL